MKVIIKEGGKIIAECKLDSERYSPFNAFNFTPAVWTGDMAVFIDDNEAMETFTITGQMIEDKHNIVIRGLKDDRYSKNK